MRRFFLIAACVVLCAPLTALPAAAEPGSVTGVVTSAADGSPVGGACVTVFDLELTEVASGCADADGNYEITGIEPGPYKARATAAGYPELWAYNKGSDLVADVVYLPGSLNFPLRRGDGTLRGRITDAGAPAAGARVSITTQSQQWWSAVRTGADGTYSFTGLVADTYQLQIAYGDREQWVPQTSNVFDAGTYPVADGQVTVVDDEVAPYKSLRVVAVDETTGAPVSGACSALFATRPPDRRICAGTDGVVQYDDLPAFEYYTLSVYADAHWSAEVRPVEFDDGEVTELRVQMRPAAAVVTTVRDAKTGAPLESICVETHAVPVVGVIDRDYTNFCSDATGRVVIGPMEPGTYQFLVKPLDERYGMQWVGAGGGTGDLREAIKVTAALGAPVAIPPIEMDPAGRIKGKVTDRATGAPVPLVCVYPYAVDPRIGFGFGENCSKGDGTYTISGLGPYPWPLEFADSRGKYAWEWSGRKPDRFAAQKIVVWPGAHTTANASLVPGGVITGRTMDQEGPAFGYVYTYNARTGDIIDWTTPMDASNQYTINSLATQDVKIQYYVDTNCWYRGAADFASATPVAVTAGQTTGGVDLGPC